MLVTRVHTGETRARTVETHARTMATSGRTTAASNACAHGGERVRTKSTVRAFFRDCMSRMLPYSSFSRCELLHNLYFRLLATKCAN